MRYGSVCSGIEASTVSMLPDWPPLALPLGGVGEHARRLEVADRAFISTLYRETLNFAILFTIERAKA